MVLRGGAFGRWVDLEEGALMKGICVLMKKTKGSSLLPSIMWGYCEKTAVYELRNQLSPDTQSALIMNCLALRNICLNAFRLNPPLCGIFVIAAQTKTLLESTVWAKNLCGGGIFEGDSRDQRWGPGSMKQKGRKSQSKVPMELVLAASNWDRILPGPSEAIICLSELLTMKNICPLAHIPAWLGVSLAAIACNLSSLLPVLFLRLSELEGELFKWGTGSRVAHRASRHICCCSGWYQR